MANPGKVIGNPVQIKEVKQPETRLLAMRVTAKSAGTPVQFPTGKVPSGEIRLSTRGNTGTVYLGDSYASVKEGTLRFGIAKDKDFSYKVGELSSLWLDADTDGDGIELLGEIGG